ncbi:MAG TPA: response regulator transcription factor [Candidatus Kapabacteria bacterium]|jgi:DNA-binding response OmpR family regulator|nr:response regulator transcription factor [Candidatus Kapabacteria bacterium]
MRILVVEDDPNIASLISEGLSAQRYVVDIAIDGESGSEMACVNDYDLVILDIILPGRDGFQVCREIRAEGVTVPVLMLTSLNGDGDVVRGLDAGADDFLPKPFSFDVLLARVRALLRRTIAQKTTQITVGGLVLDTANRSISRNGRSLDLTAKELMLLEYLMLNAGRVVTRENIAEHVWDMHFDPKSNVIDRLVHRLRQKLDRAGSSPLQTVRGLGYTLQEEEVEGQE